MDDPELTKSYLDAWNAHDADALVATFTPSGTYSDPTTNGPLSGAAIGAYAQSLWDAFPDLSFELRSHGRIADDKVVAEWTMRGTNTGPFAGMPPTGQPVRLPGIDVLQIEAGGIASVVGYFDSRAVPEQLGLHVLVQPHRLGPFTFGSCVAVQSGKKTKPGAFSITTIWNEPGQEEDIRTLSRATATEMLEMDGFIGLTLVRVGERGITISAWEKPENVKQLRTSPAHREAMARAWKDLGDSAFTSVWAPERLNPFWVRCPACQKMNDAEKSEGQCACGATLPEAPAYF